MGYRSILIRALCLTGVAALAVMAFAALRSQMWASLVFALLGLAAAAAFLLAGTTAAMPAPERNKDADLRPRAQPQPVVALLDQVPIPLLKFIEGEGLFALNLAARRLFGADDFVSNPPGTLMNAVTQAQRGVRPSVRMFEKNYALGISEVSYAGRSEKFISLTPIDAEVRIAEAAALGDTLRVISHEIMNSLTPVASLAETARTYLAEGSPEGAKAADEALALLEKRASGLRRFVEAYRALARLPSPVLRRTDLKSFVADVTRVFEQSVAAQDVRVALDMEEGAVFCDIDEALLAQALINVLTNAAEATRGATGARHVRVALQQREQDIGIVVADNGCGVDEALRERIFHGFISTKPEGGGIGLSLARQIILAHGGDLRLLEPDNDGWRSEFLFSLPVLDQAP